MNQPQPAAPVVVGIDGSPAAVAAALWAAEEALGTGAPLRLVHAISVEDDLCAECDEDPNEIARDWPETEYGLLSLRAASAAVLSTGRPISVETQILWGEVDAMLIAESERAALVCIGSVGISPLCDRTLGSTAAIVAKQAHSPVAIIRSPTRPPPNPTGSWRSSTTSPSTMRWSTGRSTKPDCAAHPCLPWVSRERMTAACTTTSSNAGSLAGGATTPVCTSIRLPCPPTSRLSFARTKSSASS